MTGRTAPRLSGLMMSTMPRVDWCDAFWVTLPRGAPTDPLFWSAVLFGDATPRRPAALMRVRDVLARQLGLKAAAIGNGAAYPVLAQCESEVVVGMDDRHLDFRVALTVRSRLTDEVLVVTTAVRRHNRLGHAYFALVMGAHHLLVPRWTRRAVRRAAVAAA